MQAVAWYAEATLSLPSKHVQLFTKLRGCAARVVTAKLCIDQLRSDGGFQALLAVLEWSYGGDSADNIMEAVSHLLDCPRGEQDTLISLVYRFGNFSISVDDRLASAVALLNSGLDRDQRAMVVASTGRSLRLPDVLLAVRQLLPGAPHATRECLFGAGHDTKSNKTPTGKGGGTVDCVTGDGLEVWTKRAPSA